MSDEMMNKNESLEKLRKRSAAIAEKHKRLEAALRQHKKAPARGDIYLFDLKAIPEDATIFWVILHCHPEDSSLFFTVPADTNPLKGVFDVSIPPIALFGFLVLRLGQGIWLPDTIFYSAQRVGMIEALFIDHAQFIMSRIAKNKWIGSDIQQATESYLDYEEWMEMLDHVCVDMMSFLEKIVPVKASWIFNNIINLGKVKETLFEYLVAPFFPSPSFQYKVSRMDETRGSATEEGSKKSNRYNVGESFGFRVGMPQDGYLTIFHYSEDGNIDLAFPVLPEDESYLSGGSKKVFVYDVKEPFGKHFLRAIWTAKQLIDLESVDPSSETEKKNTGMKFIDRLAQLGNADSLQLVYEYEVVEE